MVVHTENPRDAMPPMSDTDYLRYGVWAVMLLLLSLLVWAAFAELDEVAVAVGEVVPQEQLKVVQHLEGGVIESIHVSEGDYVARGTVLMKLNLGVLGVNREEKQIERDALLLTRERLYAELNDKSPDFPNALANRHAALVSAERATYEGRRRDIEQSLEVAQERIAQKRLQIDELNAKLAASNNDVSIKKEKLEMSAELLEKGLTSRMEHLHVKEEYEKLRGEIGVLKKAIPRARSELSQAQAEKGEILERYRLGVSEELSETERRIAKLKELLAKMEEQNRRTDVRSPIDGVVKKMRHTTVGGVVRPGEAILEIVPQSDDLVIEAKLDPVDRGYVRRGQEATVKITTYDFSRYGGLTGRVERIGADSQTEMNSGKTYFDVVVKTDKNYLGDESANLRITPGMEAMVDIHTGRRTVLNFLLKPVLKIKDEAFRER